MKKILITGVCGLIGSHLADALLSKGYRVTGLDDLSVGKLNNIRHNLRDPKFKFVKADILDAKTLGRFVRRADIVAHLAAAKKIGESGNALDTLTVNIDGTRNIFEAAKNTKAKVLLASTSDVYGLSNDIPFREDGDLVIGSPTAKRWAYAVSKICAEQLAFSYYKEYKVPVVIVRYFGCFSPRASFTSTSGHIPLFIDAILNDKAVVIHGDGKQTRSMGSVDDVVRGTVLAIQNHKAVGEIFNIGNDEEISVIGSARLIHKIASTGKKLKLKFIPYKKIFGTYEDIRRRVPCLDKAKRVLGYRPEISLADSIRHTIKIRREAI